MAAFNTNEPDVMDPANDFDLPVFDRPMVELPPTMTYEQAVAEFDEIIKAYRLRERPRESEDIPEFKM